MTDREILEQAAKAIGISVGFDEDETCCRTKAISKDGSWHWQTWMPLSDDADAFRLAVALGMEVAIDDEHSETEVRSLKYRWAGSTFVDHREGGAASATRRAIALTAYAIGYGLP